MSSVSLLVLYCAMIVLASLAGGWVLLRVQLTHRQLEIAVSFVSGVMLGIALLHMLPHALLVWGEGAGGISPKGIESVILWMLGGFLAMFFLERFFCFHHHEVHSAEDESGHTCDHGHQLSWTGALAGLTLHSLIGGIALAASVLVEEDAGVKWAGLGTFFVIFLHKPFDAMTVGTLMAKGGRSSRLRHAINGGFGLVVPIGVLLFLGGLRLEGDSSGLLVSGGLAFSAGTFLCIALSDLLPELQFHSHDRVKLSAALLLGLAVAWGVTRMGGHDHADMGHERAEPVIAIE